MKRRRVWYLTLDELGFVIGDGNVETRRGDDPAGVHRTFGGVMQGDKLVIAEELGKRKACSPAQCRDRLIARQLQLLGDRRQSAVARNPVEPADARIDRMDLTAPEKAQQFVAGLFERECPLDRVRVIAPLRSRPDNPGNPARAA
jgi:hypothetical protein